MDEKHTTYRIGNYQKNLDLIRARCMIMTPIQSKTQMGYRTSVGDITIFVYYDAQAMGEQGNVVLHGEGPNKEGIDKQIANLERLLCVETREMTEGEEEEILPNVLVK